MLTPLSAATLDIDHTTLELHTTWELHASRPQGKTKLYTFDIDSYVVTFICIIGKKNLASYIPCDYVIYLGNRSRRRWLLAHLLADGSDLLDMNVEELRIIPILG
jgi:hypothetical protein